MDACECLNQRGDVLERLLRTPDPHRHRRVGRNAEPLPPGRQPLAVDGRAEAADVRRDVRDVDALRRDAVAMTRLPLSLAQHAHAVRPAQRPARQPLQCAIVQPLAAEIWIVHGRRVHLDDQRHAEAAAEAQPDQRGQERILAGDQIHRLLAVKLQTEPIAVAQVLKVAARFRRPGRDARRSILGKRLRRTTVADRHADAADLFRVRVVARARVADRLRQHRFAEAHHQYVHCISP
jgi:hypothetical protein